MYYLVTFFFRAFRRLDFFIRIIASMCAILSSILKYVFKVLESAIIGSTGTSVVKLLTALVCQCGDNECTYHILSILGKRSPSSVNLAIHVTFRLIVLASHILLNVSFLFHEIDFCFLFFKKSINRLLLLRSISNSSAF